MKITSFLPFFSLVDFLIESFFFSTVSNFLYFRTVSFLCLLLPYHQTVVKGVSDWDRSLLESIRFMMMHFPLNRTFAIRWKMCANFDNAFYCF